MTACGQGDTHNDSAVTKSTLRARPRVAGPADQLAKLTASDGEAADLFGSAVAIAGDTAVVAASRDDDVATDAGAAYVFARSGTSWVQSAKLHASDGGANDHLGAAMATDGASILVGAPFASSDVSGSGAAYVFVRAGAGWVQEAKLVADDRFSEQQLGISVAIAGDTAVVGTIEDADNGSRAGAAYVFVRAGGVWTQEAKLLASDGAPSDQFGISVAVAGDTALVGAWGDDDLGNSSGTAFVYTRSGTAWTQQAKLVASDGGDGDQFGVSVALSGDTALIGANLDDNENGTDAGGAYLFVRSGAGWTQQAKVIAADGRGGDQFATSIALSGDTALIGAPESSGLGVGAAAGTAYVFTRDDGAWAQANELVASDGAGVEFFGSLVAVSGNTALVGAFGDATHGTNAGAAYLFGPPRAPGDNGGACASDAECPSGFCVEGVCCNTACGRDGDNACEACSVATGGQIDGTCGPRAAGTLCRAAAGVCDVAEKCDGVALACPPDARVAAGTSCRGATGVCDVAEKCDGVAADCPDDRVDPAGVVCRPAAGSCDLAETCTGTGGACPANRLKPDLSLCTGGLLGLPGLCIAGKCIL
jgi:hypothetical protein